MAKRARSRAGSRRERGSTTVVVLGMVLICAAISMAAIVPNLSRHREAQAHLDRQRAFHLAESGVDWAISEIRANDGNIEVGTTVTHYPGNGKSGSYTVTFSAWNEGGAGGDEADDPVVVVDVDDVVPTTSDDDGSGKSTSDDDASGSSEGTDDSGSGKSSDDSTSAGHEKTGRARFFSETPRTAHGSGRAAVHHTVGGDDKDKDDTSGSSKSDDDTSGSSKSDDDTSGSSKGDDDTSGSSKGDDDTSGSSKGDDDDDDVSLPDLGIVTSTGDSTDSGTGSTTTYEIISTGEINGHRQTIRVLARRAMTMPTLGGALHLNVDDPIVDMSGNSFFISGLDHDLNGDVDEFGTPQYGLTSPAAVADITAQIDSKNYDQIEGIGTNPSINEIKKIDLDTLANEAKITADDIIEPGTQSQLSLGSPTKDGVVVAYCGGDLHLTGQASGYGTLVVDGDLTSTGQFLWTGIVIVRGRATFTGGGSTNRVIGAVIIGEEIATGGVTTTDDDSATTEDDDGTSKSDDSSSGTSKSDDSESEDSYFYAPPGSDDDDASGASESDDDASGESKGDDDTSGKSKGDDDDEKDTSTKKSDSHVSVSGTVDILYSTEAIALTSDRLALTTLLSWQIVADPDQ